MDINTVYDYATFLIKGLRLILKPEYSIVCDIYPYDKGYILNISLPEGTGSTISIKDEDNLSNILKAIGVKEINGITNFDNITFKGTNIIITKDSIVFIKDKDEKIWSGTAAGDDIKRLIERK